jgi:hypothetical protein
MTFESVSTWSLIIFQSLYNYNVAKHTQDEVVEFLASMLMCVPEKQRDDVVWHVSYGMLKYKLHAIPDGTYGYILTPRELDPPMTSKQVDAYLEKVTRPRGLIIEDVTIEKMDIESVIYDIHYCTYKDIDVVIDETTEEIPERKDIICHYDQFRLKENWTIEIVLTLLIICALVAITYNML